jgi:hypothetical protein
MQVAQMNCELPQKQINGHQSGRYFSHFGFAHNRHQYRRHGYRVKPGMTDECHPRSQIVTPGEDPGSIPCHPGPPTCHPGLDPGSMTSGDMDTGSSPISANLKTYF